LGKKSNVKLSSSRNLFFQLHEVYLLNNCKAMSFLNLSQQITFYSLYRMLWQIQKICHILLC